MRFFNQTPISSPGLICQGDALTNPSQIRSRARGFSTIELLIAMAIGIIVMTGVVLVTFGNQASVISSGTNADATAIAQQSLERAQALGRQDFNLVNSTTSTERRDGITYTKATTVTLLSDYLTKQVTTIVSWVNERGLTLSTTLTTLVTNLLNVNSPSMCSSTMTNPEGWKSPLDTPFDFQQLLYGNNGNGLTLSSVVAFFNKLYVVAATPPNNPNDNETMFVLDISGASPVFLGSVDNDADQTSAYGLNDIAVASSSGKVYAFVANNNDNDFYFCAQSAKCSQMQIIDSTDAVAPIVVRNLKFSTTSAPYVWGNHPTANDEAVGKSIYYANGYIYLGLTTTANGPGFHIIDVSDPLNPSWVGSWPASTPSFGSSGAPISSIYVRGNYAYLSHPEGLVGGSNEQLTVLDVSDPSNPSRVTGFDHAGGNASAEGRSSMVIGDTLYFGRTASDNSVSDGIAEFFVLDNSNPSSVPVTPLASATLGVSEGINNLLIRENLAFLLTTTQFKVLNLSNLANITTWGSLALPGHGGSAFDCDGDRFFIIHDVNKDYVSIVTPSAPIDYTLVASGNISVDPGDAGNVTIAKTTVSGSSAVTLSASGLPSGATASFSNNPCTPTCSSTLTISTTAATAPGTYPITVTGSPNGTSNPSTTFNLIVRGLDYSLSNSGNISVVKGAQASTTVTRTYISGPASAVGLSVSGLPTGATVTYSATTCTPTCTTTLGIQTSASTPEGTHPIVVTGSPNGTSNPSTTFNLVVSAAPFDYSISVSPSSISVPRSTSGTVTVTLTKLSGTEQAVSVTMTGFQNNVSYLPAPGTCTPNPTCTISFSIVAASNAQKVTRTITVTGASPTHSTTFDVTVP